MYSRRLWRFLGLHDYALGIQANVHYVIIDSWCSTNTVMPPIGLPVLTGPQSVL